MREVVDIPGFDGFGLVCGIGVADTYPRGMDPTQTLTAFDRYLASTGLQFEAVVIGGAALALLGITTRQTRDCDVLDPVLPKDIARAAREFAAQQRAAGNELMDDWLNNGPRDLVNVLPHGWPERVVDLLAGEALLLRTLGREDLLCTKLFALSDRGLDLADCLALKPTPRELAKLQPWVECQDVNPDWPAHVRATLEDLGRRLGHGL
ncbi:MAG: hypothetical protein ACI8QC_000466 [Planctomycetota bacterium]